MAEQPSGRAVMGRVDVSRMPPYVPSSDVPIRDRIAKIARDCLASGEGQIVPYDWLMEAVEALDHIGQVDHLMHVIDRDRYIVALGINSIIGQIRGRTWLLEDGRGNYEWDDERYKEEFGDAINAIELALGPLRKVAWDKSDCTNIEARVEAARNAAKDFLKLPLGPREMIGADIFGLHETQRTQGIEGLTFQDRVLPWLLECFGADVASDKLERSDRFIEEALELVQSLNYTEDRAHALVAYVFGRPAGEPNQEAGGVMTTLAALCLANKLDMHHAGETELERISRPEVVLKIRAKQAAKPSGSALPIAT